MENLEEILVATRVERKELFELENHFNNQDVMNCECMTEYFDLEIAVKNARFKLLNLLDQYQLSVSQKKLISNNFAFG